jgi:hypothetical protein
MVALVGGFQNVGRANYFKIIRAKFLARRLRAEEGYSMLFSKIIVFVFSASTFEKKNRAGKIRVFSFDVLFKPAFGSVLTEPLECLKKALAHKK